MVNLAALVSLSSERLCAIIAGASMTSTPAYRLAVCTLRARRNRERGVVSLAESNEAEALAILTGAA
jgi:hypothetical protein